MLLFYVLNYYYFIDLANDELIESLKQLAPSYVLLDLDFLTFNLNVVIFNILMIVVLTSISLIIPMIKIKKIKPFKIIKTKDKTKRPLENKLVVF